MSVRNNDSSPSQEERSKRQERANRILDAASELIQRWGYRKTTIDDIAKQASVAKGTIYLHWKTREDLFIALFQRERIIATQDMMQRAASDPESVTLHGITKYSILAALKNPLIRALMLRDSEILGDLVHSEFGKRDFEQRLAVGKGYLEMLRNKGLIRTDLSLREEIQMLGAISTGFLLVNQFLTEEYQMSDEEIADRLAQTIKRTLEIRELTQVERQEAATIVNQAVDNITEQRQKELKL